MQHTTEKPSKLKSGVASLEDAIIVISGPALAISGIIAGVDLVTGGNILKSMGWLTLTWAITLLLTLDFQVLCLGVRSHRIYSSKKHLVLKIIEIGIMMLIAAAISSVSIQMQSIIARVNAENISLDLASAQLGINMIWLIWERSTLVLVLIFVSGWLREHDITPAPSISDDTMTVILARLEKLDKLEQHITGHMQAIVVSEQPSQALLPPVENDELSLSVNAVNAFQENAGKGKIELKRDAVIVHERTIPMPSARNCADC